MDKKNILQMDIKDLFKSDIKINPKNVLILVAILFGIVIYGYFILYPKYNEYAQVNDELELKNQELENDKIELDKRPQLKEELAHLSVELNAKSKRLSYDMEDGMFLVGLSNIMREYGVDLLDYTIEESIPYEGFYAVPTTLKIRGNYRYIREIMYYLEEQKNVTQIQNFTMETYIPEVKINPSNSNNLNPELGGIDLGPSPKAKANGEVTADFKFVIYMSENPKLNLQTENPNDWKPGKFNPFVDTTN